MKLDRRRFLSGGLVGLAATRLDEASWGEQGDATQEGRFREEEKNSVLSGPKFRIGNGGWGSAETSEVREVVGSAAGVLWKYFPGINREPFVVVRGRDGPIVHYQRNVMGEIVMKLDTEDYLWCQYVYQFSHEFCHILCAFDADKWKRNNWFEETLCETASLFVLRRLTDVWSERPPFPNWRNYAPEFRRYAQRVMDGRNQVGSGHLADFYRKHRVTLEQTPRDRSLNGAMALPLLELIEASPESWEAVAWLNSSPSLEGETFGAYLEKWRRAVPVRHRDFVTEVMRRFNIDTSPRGASGPSGPRHSRD